MILRILTLLFGLTGAAGLSQFPEFSQQYRQRLGGAVDELTRIVQGFDADARATGLTRAEALEDLAKGGDFGQRHSASMRITIDRYDRLRGDLAALEGAGPFTRLTQMSRLTDPELARATLDNYSPALPLSFEGATLAGTGFLLGGMVPTSLAWTLGPILPGSGERRRRRRAARAR